MYSKFNDRPRPIRPSAVPQGGPSYRQRVRVPPNYSGLAIVDGEERLPGTDAVPDLRAPTDIPTGNLPDNRDFGHESPPEPRFAAVEPLGEIPHRDHRSLPVAYTEPEAPEVPARTGGLFDIAHFPFGHGLGTEEWLLIGLILLLLHEAGNGPEGRGDLDETVILLALLLLGG